MSRPIYVNEPSRRQAMRFWTVCWAFTWLFTGLKLVGFIDWSWILVLSPVLVPTLFIVLFLLALGAVALVSLKIDS